MAMAPWMRQAIESNIQASQRESSQPYVPHPGHFAPRNAFEKLAAERVTQGAMHHPHMNASIEAANRGAEQFPEHYQRYMDPYQQAVVDRIAELGNRNLFEKILPQLQAKYVRLGQHGGSQHNRDTERGIRDIQSEISGRQAEALSHGYGQAMAGFNADQGRLMDLARQRQELGSMTVAERLAEITNLRQQAAMERDQEEAPLQHAAAEHRATQMWPMQQRAAHTAVLYGMPSYSAPHDPRRALRHRDWLNIGLRTGANVLGGI